MKTHIPKATPTIESGCNRCGRESAISELTDAKRLFCIWCDWQLIRATCKSLTIQETRAMRKEFLKDIIFPGKRYY